LTKRDLSGEDQVRFGKYLESAFLLDEINNVVAGQGAVDWETYSQVGRRGRQFRNLRKGGPEREVIWKAINRHPTGAFPFRWWTLIESNLDRLASEEPLIEVPFDHVFVDEAQDFTEYQLRFIGGLAVRPSRLVVAIDQAQSIRIGPSFSRPKFRRKWADKHELKGSYRLPVRVAEASRPLADSISKRHGSTGRKPDTVSPISRKAAVLGFRPIVINGDHPEDLDEVLRTYLRRVPDELAGTITVAQERGGRNGLAPRIEALVSEDWNVRGEWVESIKGQERSVVVWRSAALRGDPIGMAETIYTIATRTTSLLILQLDSETPSATQAVIGRLERERLLFWSPDARRRYDRFAALVGGDDDPLADMDVASAEPGSIRPSYEIFSVDESASAGVPIGKDSAVRVGRQSVWQEDDVVFVSEGKGSTPQGFKVGVFDEAFTAWVGSGMSMNAAGLARVSDSVRLRTLLRLFNKGTVRDSVESAEVASA
ncbi:MAG: hypothetical protein U9R47_05250, partial [Actinomycetota bacterium]|nr:hypothetical protein [Actinomycetota bacterium]